MLSSLPMRHGPQDQRFHEFWITAALRRQQPGPRPNRGLSDPRRFAGSVSPVLRCRPRRANPS